MKVSSTSSTSSSGPASSSGAGSGASGFRDLLSGVGAAGRAGAAGAAAPAGGAASVGAVGALFALQGIGAGSPEARSLALRKGRRLLAALDRLQADILGRGATTANLRDLTSALEEERLASGDADLDDTLGWAEVRVAVEAAKLEMAARNG